MKRYVLLSILVALALVASLLAGCSEPAPEKPASEPKTETPSAETPDAESPSSGARLAPGFYELEDGVAQAVGTLDYNAELEGGVWFLTGGLPPNEDATIAVIANADYFQRQLEPLKGRTVLLTGKKVDGASVRMAGPEIEIEKVEELSDTPGIVE